MPLLVNQPINPLESVPSWYLPTDPIARAATIRKGRNQILFDRAYHPDVQDYWRRVLLAGGSVAIPKLIALNKAVLAIYASGLRGTTNFLKYWLCLNLTQSFTGCLAPVYDDGVGNATNSNFVSGDWSSVQGLAGNGTSKYLDLGWNPSAKLGTFSIAGRCDIHISAWVTERISGAGFNPLLIGCGGSDYPDFLFLGINTAQTFYFADILPDTSANEIITTSTATGLILGNRPDKFLSQLVVNNSGANGSTTITSLVDPNQTIYGFAANNFGAINFCPLKISNFTAGMGLSTTQATALYSSLLLVN